MTDTTINPTVTATVPTRRPRIKDAVASGICDGTAAAVKIVNSAADVVGACATRIKLHNIGTAADMLDEYGSDKVNAAAALIANL